MGRRHGQVGTQDSRQSMTTGQFFSNASPPSEIPLDSFTRRSILGGRSILNGPRCPIAESLLRREPQRPTWGGESAAKLKPLNFANKARFGATSPAFRWRHTLRAFALRGFRCQRTKLGWRSTTGEFFGIHLRCELYILRPGGDKSSAGNCFACRAWYADYFQADVGLKSREASHRVGLVATRLESA